MASLTKAAQSALMFLSDFPYRSGAFGYMSYPSEEIRERKNALCLITHRHADHFEPDLVRKVGCTLVAPKEVTEQLEDAPSLPLGARIQFGPITIEPVRTPHRNLEHYSYIVTWHGLRLYFTGDTESNEELLEIRDLDVLFVTPWLVESVRRAGQDMPAKKSVVYHHTVKKPLSDCADCVVLGHGEAFAVRAPSN